MRFRFLAIVVAISALVSAASAAAVVGLWPDDKDGPGEPTASATTASLPASATPVTPTPAQASVPSSCLAPADIYARLRPAVAQIRATVRTRSSFAPSEGVGSGIIIDRSGIILTNYHVVAGADSLEVRFADGTTAEARALGSDPGNDLALIQTAAPQEKLVTAPLGDSGALRVGDPVLAIGSPFNLEGTLTQGIVSALGRIYASDGETRPLRGMIQTDTPVNPGNSGGPLINCRGEVVGVNTLIENPTGERVNVGVAFAVPVNTAKRFLPEMLAGKTVAHPWLGIAGEEVTPALAQELGLPVQSGIYVAAVADDSPAERAGLREAPGGAGAGANPRGLPPGGDVITAVDGRDVTTIDELADYLDTQKKVGETVTLTIRRGGAPLQVDATLSNWPG